ncbi:MAG: helix-turn-helix domain-containing protein [Candidatus Thiodiazotropha weberae]|nr:helix-turn-helix domain-containing protein [Candidatus Thiodiazotropha weberae]
MQDKGSKDFVEEQRLVRTGQSHRIKTLMFREKMTNSELADELNVAENTVKKWLNGSNQCSRLPQIAQLFNVSEIWLVHGEGCPDPVSITRKRLMLLSDLVDLTPEKNWKIEYLNGKFLLEIDDG